MANIRRSKTGDNTGELIQKDAPAVDIVDDAWADERAQRVAMYFRENPDMVGKVDPFFAPKEYDADVLEQRGYKPAIDKKKSKQINDRGDLMWVIDAKLHRRRIGAPGRIAAEQTLEALRGENDKYSVRDADGNVLRPSAAYRERNKNEGDSNMATLTLANPRVVSGAPLEKITSLVGNGESWKAGQFLTINTSGALTSSVSDEDAGTGGIQYFAITDQDDPGDATTTTEVLKITADTIFEGNVYHGTAASALATAAIQGQHYGLNVASNVCSVDIADTSNPAFEVVEIGSVYSPVENSAADVYGRIRFKLLTVVLEAALAA